MHEKNPFVSIIIPFFNNEAYASRAIDSALKQTFEEKEIILVDNNSTDNTINILKAYESQYPALIRVFQECKQGCPAARNKGLFEAKGEWIQILDSDDELMPQKIEHQVPLTSDGEVGLIIGGTCKHRIINGKQHTYIKRPDTGDVWRSLLLWKLGSTNACLWKKDVLLSAKGWNESWSSVEDYELYFRVIKGGVKIAISPFAEAVVHMRGDSMSRSNNYKIYTGHIEHALKARLMIRDYMKSKGLLTTALEQELNEVLYRKLLGWKPKAPDYVKKKMDELRLNLPISKRIRFNVNALKARTSKKFKMLFNL